MAEMIPGRVLYAPRLDTVDAMRALKKECADNDHILVGEYGRLSPLAFFHELKELGCAHILVEILLKNKNRDLAESYLLTASVLGYRGAVLAMGRFDERPGMPMPVYDLDTVQALRLALDLRNAGKLRTDFIIGVRAASGGGAAETRARAFILDGADFIVLSGGELIHGLEDRTVIVDAPPGTSCPAVASIRGSDYCVLVTEPTPFGINDLELATLAAHPELSGIKQRLMALGARGALMSGSGPTVFGVFAGPQAARAAARQLADQDRWWVRVCRGHRA